VHEADCRGFFTCTLAAAQGALALEIAVPSEPAHVLDGIAAQPGAALQKGLAPFSAGSGRCARRSPTAR
jgi:hypothetical protein